MTYKEVATMIKGIGYPCAYYQFPEGTEQTCPFICFYFTRSNDLAADDTNYQKIRQLVVELYTDNKDFAKEETVENALNASGLVFSREESYIDSERMYMVTFITEVVVTDEVITTEETITTEENNNNG
jgi:hypothetical protein